MTATIINGRNLAQTLQQGLTEEIIALKDQCVPSLAVLQVGDDPATTIYVRNKQKACEKVGIRFSKHCFPVSTPFQHLQQCIAMLNNDPTIHGILLQLPLPTHYPVQHVIDCIQPEKDVDGLTTHNIGRLWSGQESLIPCTPLGCMALLKTQFPSLQGKIVTILGRSAIVGRPLSYLLSRENATVITCHSYTPQPEKFCQQSDIVIAAVGHPQLVKDFWIKPGAAIIDVGINRIITPQGIVLQGDVDFNAVLNRCQAITPVPGGVGPMTITYLLKNVLKAAKAQYKI